MLARWLCVIALLGACSPLASHAALIIGGTRVIYPSDAREVSVQISNQGDSPSLMQAWIDRGDSNAQPDDSDVPFLILPPLSRVEPGGGQILRLTFLGDDSLPADRESVFWLNILDIPPAPERSADANQPQNILQLAIRSRVKLFYRPAALASQHPNESGMKLRWTVADGGRGIEAHNPTPFYVTLTQVDAMTADGANPLAFDDGMLAPGSRLALPLPTGVYPRQLRFTYINDYGGRVTRDAQLTQP